MAHSEKKSIIQCKKLDNDDVDMYSLLKNLSCNKSVDCPCNSCNSFTNLTYNVK